MFDLLLAKDLHPFLDRLESLLACFSLLATEYQLRNQSPFTGDVPFLAHRLVDEGVIVLQVGAEAERLKGSPEEELMHGVRVLSPLSKVILVCSKLLRHRLDMSRVLVEEDRPSSSLETPQLRQGMVGPHVLGNSAALYQVSHGVDHNIPQAIVLLVQQHH